MRFVRQFCLAFVLSVFAASSDGCVSRSDYVSSSVGHVAKDAPKASFLTAPFQTLEVDHERSTTFLAGNLGFLVAAVAVFLALRVPLMSKTMWTLAIVAAGYGVFSIVFATFYTYIIIGFFILAILAAVVAILYTAKHQLAIKSATTLADEYEKVIAPHGPSLTEKAKQEASTLQDKLGVRALVAKIRGK
jgi:hypothetical protein